MDGQMEGRTDGGEIYARKEDGQRSCHQINVNKTVSCLKTNKTKTRGLKLDNVLSHQSHFISQKNKKKLAFVWLTINLAWGKIYHFLKLRAL